VKQRRGGSGHTLLLAAATLVLAASGCAGSPTHAAAHHSQGGPELVYPDGGGATLELQSIPRERPLTIATMLICAERASQPTPITAVTLPPTAHGLAIVDYGTRPNPILAGVHNLTGEKYGLARSRGYPHRTVEVCKTPRSPEGPTPTSELAVTIERTGPGTGMTPGFVLHYPGLTHDRTLTIRYNIILCSPPATLTSGCGK
jgi:hypothetical protein